MINFPHMFNRLTGRTIASAALMAALAAYSGDLRTDRTISAERASNYVAAHPDLPAATAGDISRLRARIGMIMEQVIAAWGRPAVVQCYRGGAQKFWFFGCDWPHHCSNSDDDLFPTPNEIFSSQILLENDVAVDVRS